MKTILLATALFASVVSAQVPLTFGVPVSQGDLTILIGPQDLSLLPSSVPVLGQQTIFIMVSFATSDPATTSFQLTVVFTDSGGRIQKQIQTVTRSVVSSYTTTAVYTNPQNLMSLSIEENKPIAYFKVASIR